MDNIVYSHDGSRIILRPGVPRSGIKPGDRIEAVKNGRTYEGIVGKIFECKHQGADTYYTEYRCDTFACHGNEITKRPQP